MYSARFYVGLKTFRQALLAKGMAPDDVADVLVHDALEVLGAFEPPDITPPTKVTSGSADEILIAARTLLASISSSQTTHGVVFPQ